MGNDFKSITLKTFPTFLKGASRVIDLYGKLDEYNYQDNPDCLALKKDWETVGKDLYKSIDKYEQEK